MIVRNFDIKIDDDAPFDNDAFGRTEIADNLTRLVATTTEPYVLALDAGWGSGKTTFIQMWMRKMQSEGKQTLYFNAWENDFASDPMISFIGEMQSMIETGDFGTDTETPANQQFDKLKEVGGKIVRRGVPIAVRLLTAGVLDLKDEDLETAFSDFAEQVAKEQIERYEADRDSLIEFREALGSIAQSIYRDTGSPLIFFVDELDRCKPTYAVELLERLKHLFSVPNIVFVLSLDKEQLIHSIHSVYGIGMDARGYLRRFIDVEYRLPDPDLDNYIDALADRLNLGIAFQNRDRQDLESFYSVLKSSVALMKPSIRELQLVMARIGVIFKAFTFNRWTDFLLIPFLVVLRSSRHDLYRDFMYERSNKQELLDLIWDDMKTQNSHNRINLIVLTEYFYTSQGNRAEIVSKYATQAEQAPEESMERRELARISDLINRFDQLETDVFRGPLVMDEQYLRTVLEFAGRFNTE